jgi:hypothetical protein
MTAKAVEPLLKKWRPAMFANAATKTLADTGGSNLIELEIYYLK